jgi:hypothetical protein
MKGTEEISSLASRLIAEIAARMLEDDARADEIAYMRHDLMHTFAVYVPGVFRRAA